MPLLSALLALAVQLPQVPDPRPPYWQQQVAYDISASLDEPSGVLSGGEKITYRNRSPDTLTTFSLHLHLNAFRPGSRWAAADSVERRRRFNDLKEPDFGFNHVSGVRIMGRSVEASYPLAPDSTIVRYGLPQPLVPGDSMTVEMSWDARPSTLPRRQGRRGRRFDFAQWYPKVVVYDRHGWEEHALYPGGEFYGEFATFRATLDVPEDEVMGATGVTLCGDPGWERANQNPSQPVEYQRDYYAETSPEIAITSGGAATPGTGYCGFKDRAAEDAPPAAGRKRILWYAEDVHHFAMSLNPEYRYEGGRYGGVAVHVLYQPGDERSWGGGVAVRRTETALEWLDQLFGKFAWPQITNVHRIEGGGTEFPMMIHDGSADQGLIVHELGHNYLMGILANNEWREGWLDEGFTSFQTTWFWEQQGRPGGYENSEEFILDEDLDGASEPTSLVSEQYRDFTSYNIAVYTQGELFLHQLRYVVGDETMRRILRTYYDRWKLKHVDEQAFREVAEEVSGRDLSTLFAQGLHGTPLFDYAVGRVKRERGTGNGELGNGAPAGQWMTKVEVIRKSPGRIPVEVAAIRGNDTTIVRAEGTAEREWVEIATAAKPREIVLDPRARTHDWNMLNNRRRLGFHFGGDPKTEPYLDRLFSTRARRDRLTSAWLPTVWYNDGGGLVLGLRTRENYLGRFEENLVWAGASTGWGVDLNPHKRWQLFARFRNPVWLRSPRLSETLEFFTIEGRTGARVALDRTFKEHLTFGPTTVAGLSLQWLATSDTSYLDPGFYENAGTVELQGSVRWTDRSGPWSLAASLSPGGGVSYSHRGSGIRTQDRYDAQLYFHGTAELTAKRSLGSRFSLALRGFAGVAEGQDPVLRQRRIYLSGADPYQQLSDPFTRSRGALLVQPGVNYQTPGGAGLRGFDPHLSASQAYALNGELIRTVVERRGARLFNRVTFAAFGDVALANGDLNAGRPDNRLRVAGDAGVGVRIDHQLGDTRFVTRLDLPLYVSHDRFAQDQGAGSHRVGLRWMVSFENAF